jgi:protein-tyrosine-phosphatase
VADRPFNVLFLCTGNSARSIIAETILNKVGAGRFRAYSAGSHPKGRVNPHTIQLLQSLDYDTSGFRWKSWSEFAKPGAPPLDFVFTVCDNAAGEACPVMAKKVASDRSLDFEGMKQAVRNAIEIYESEIAGGQNQTNIDAIVDEALGNARALVDKGKFRLARATLRKAGEEMRREEEERHERYVLGITALFNRERDIALAAYDGEAAAEAIVALADALHSANAALTVKFLNSESEKLYEYGRDRGSNVHLTALIALRRELLAFAASDEERGTAHDNLGTALWTLGARESGTARLARLCRRASISLRHIGAIG